MSMALERLRPVIAEYEAEFEGGPDILLSQILADLRHYADANGLDFHQEDREAHQMYLEDGR